MKNVIFSGLVFLAISSAAFAVGSRDGLDSDQMQLANALFQNQTGIHDALSGAGITDAVDFQNGFEFEGGDPAIVSQGYTFTVERCVRRIPTPTCTALGTLTIATEKSYTPGGPISHTEVTFSPAVSQ
jgi:hypothetical protein